MQELVSSFHGIPPLFASSCQAIIQASYQPDEIIQHSEFFSKTTNLKPIFQIAAIR
jgi:hypothetical protein